MIGSTNSFLDMWRIFKAFALIATLTVVGLAVASLAGGASCLIVSLLQ